MEQDLTDSWFVASRQPIAKHVITDSALVLTEESIIGLWRHFRQSNGWTGGHLALNQSAYSAMYEQLQPIFASITQGRNQELAFHIGCGTGEVILILRRGDEYQIQVGNLFGRPRIDSESLPEGGRKVIVEQSYIRYTDDLDEVD